MPDVTISLNSKANLGGFQQTTAASKSLSDAIAKLDTGLRAADRRAHASVSSWEKHLDGVMKGFTRSFRPEQIVRSFLGGAGIGTAFAMIDKLTTAATEKNRQLADSVDAVRKAEEALAEAREKIYRASLTPRQALTSDQVDLAAVEARIAELKAIEAPTATLGFDENGQVVETQKVTKRTVVQNTELAGLLKKQAELVAAIATLESQITTEQEKQIDASNKLLAQDDEKKKKSEAERNEKLNARLVKLGEAQAEAEFEKLAPLEQINLLLEEDARLRAEAARINQNDIAQLERGADIEERRLEIARQVAVAYRNAAAAVDQMLSKQLGALGRDKALVSANPALTDMERRKQLIPILEKERDLLNGRVAALEKEVELAANPELRNMLQMRLESLRGLQAENAAAIMGANPATRTQQNANAQRDLADPTKHYQTAGEGALGGVMNFLTQLGTMADQVAAGIENTLGAAVSSITQGIMGWVNGTMTFKQALANIGQSILQSMLQTIVQMGVQWIVNGVIMKGVMAGIEALGDAYRTARTAKEIAAEGATLPIKTAGAAASGISSFGVALAFGALAVGLIASLAGGFADGGFTPGGPKMKPAGVVHAGEWVAPQWMVTHPVFGSLIASLEATRTGAQGFSAGGLFGALLSPASALTRPLVAPSLGSADGVAGSGRGRANAQFNARFLVVNDRQEAKRQLMRDPEFQDYVIDLVSERRFDIPGMSA